MKALSVTNLGTAWSALGIFLSLNSRVETLVEEAKKDLLTKTGSLQSTFTRTAIRLTS